MKNKFIILLCVIVFYLSCSSDGVVKFFEYPDHNVLNIGSQLTDLYITNDSNTLIAADKGNNRVIFIDVSSDAMSITKRVWVGSEPTSLDMTDDNRYLFVGLLGGSSVSIINMATMTLEGSLSLQEDSVFDVEYLSSKCQLIVSFISGSVNFSKTYVHPWWADQDGVWYGSNNTLCTYAEIPEINISSQNIYIAEPPEIDNVLLAGHISVSTNDSLLFVNDKSLNPDRLFRYEITDDGLINEINSNPTSEHIILLHDLVYIDGFGVVMAIDGTDPSDASPIDHSAVYDIDNLNQKSNLDVGSVPLAIAYDAVGKHIYISPTDVDDNGMFIIEFSVDTQLQTNYYQVAGLLGSHTLAVDPKGEYIYAAVDDLSDQDTHEPYNGSSFNIQKIKIISEGTYPINDF